MRKMLRLNLFICLLCLLCLSGASTYGEEMTISRVANETSREKIATNPKPVGKEGLPDEENAIDPTSIDDITLALSRLAIETEADDIPEAAYRAAKVAVLDALGCAMAGYDAPGVPAVVGLEKEWGGRGEATVWFHGGKVPGPAATFANSVQVHALDLDDIHYESVAHITSVVVPAAFAMGELHGASGRETLAAVILGAEVACRLGRAGGRTEAGRARRAHGGFLDSSVFGGFGATVSAARLQGCTVKQTVDAIGVWYAHASGNRQALFDHTLTKRIQPGIAARAGVFATYLAKEGVTGPRRIIGGQPASLTQIYGYRRDAKPPTVGEIMAPLPSYEIERLGYKRYAACGGSHLLIEAALALATEHDLKPADIDTIEIFGLGVKHAMVGAPWTDHENPHVLAQFSAPYAVASVIEHRRFGPAEITNERIAEAREVDALARRSHLRAWSAWGDKKRPGQHAVRIILRDGRTLEAGRNRDDVLSPEANPYKQLVEKFKYNVTFSKLVDEKGADEMVKAIENLDKCAKIATFVEKYLNYEEK